MIIIYQDPHPGRPPRLRRPASLAPGAPYFTISIRIGIQIGDSKCGVFLEVGRLPASRSLSNKENVTRVATVRQIRRIATFSQVSGMINTRLCTSVIGP
jgi:hypothetical protein